MDKREITVDTKHIDVLDGIRAIAMLIVVWYHIWQQSWLMPIFETKWLKILNISQVNLDWLPRSGYEIVDLFILLSGFCLFLPHARNMIEGEPLERTTRYYIKRIARILPSYLLCIVIILVFFVFPNQEYTNNTEAFRDIVSHLSFTHTFFFDTYIGTKINPVLWTVAVEVQFYLIFPIIAMCFRKFPCITYFFMVLFSYFYNQNIVLGGAADTLAMRINQMPTFLGVYANGMLGALLFVGIAKQIKYNKYMSILFTGISIYCIYSYYCMANQLIQSNDTRVWQVKYRFIISVLFLIFILSTIFAVKQYRQIFSNRMMKFLSTISFNLYIWHQFIAVKLKMYHIPSWNGTEEPNRSGDFLWQIKYTLLSFLVSILVATIVTYVIEKPIYRFIVRSKQQKLLQVESEKQ